jgi:protein-tyrosine phosphatase
MRAEGAATLARDLTEIGVAWRHMPITDFGIPTEAEGALWPRLAEEVSGWLARGGRVILHCRGGCGRSGMIALRLMAEAGEDPREALSRLRKIRPCAVETEEQYGWATEGL